MFLTSHMTFPFRLLFYYLFLPRCASSFRLRVSTCIRHGYRVLGQPTGHSQVTPPPLARCRVRLPLVLVYCANVLAWYESTSSLTLTQCIIKVITIRLQAGVHLYHVRVLRNWQILAVGRSYWSLEICMLSACYPSKRSSGSQHF
jgi:hypothetical protein